MLSLLGTGGFEPAISVPLLLEYEEVLKRQSPHFGLTLRDVDALLDYFCSIARHQPVFFLWRPLLPDPGDDMILELAVAASCDLIVTHNAAHFAGCGRFGLQALPPREFLPRLGDAR